MMKRLDCAKRLDYGVNVVLNFVMSCYNFLTWGSNMPIDKNWTQLRNCLCDEYRLVKSFLERAQNHLSSFQKIRCPCWDCYNVKWHFLHVVEAHLLDRGMKESYKLEPWIHHGEANDKNVAEGVEGNDKPVCDAQNDDYFDMFHDIAGASYGQLENDDEDPNLGMFDHLFEDMKRPLHPEYENFSVFTFLVRLMHIKVLNKWTNKSFDMVLKLLLEAFPKGTKLPVSNYEAKSYLRALGLVYESIHACKYDCVLFWKENANLEEYPVCGESR